MVSHSVMESAVFSGCWPLRLGGNGVGRLTTFDGVETWSTGISNGVKLASSPVGLGRVPWRSFVDCAESSILTFL